MKCTKPATPYLAILFLTLGFALMAAPTAETTEISAEQNSESHGQLALSQPEVSSPLNTIADE